MRFTHWVSEYAWALWLAAPLLVVALASLWTWWRGRPTKPVSVRKAMRRHDDFLDTLRTVTAGRPQPRYVGDATAVQSLEGMSDRGDVPGPTSLAS